MVISGEFPEDVKQKTQTLNRFRQLWNEFIAGSFYVVTGTVAGGDGTYPRLEPNAI